MCSETEGLSRGKPLDTGASSELTDELHERLVTDCDPESGVMAAYYPESDTSSRQVFAVREGVPLSREGDGATSYKAMVLALAPVLCAT